MYIEHYINPNYDVWVGENPPEGFWRIDSDSIYPGEQIQVVLKYGLYWVSWARANAEYKRHNTAWGAIMAKLTEKFPNDPYVYPEIYARTPVPREYRKYDYFYLASLYGNNHYGFRIKKSFLISKEFLDEIFANYDSAKIDKYQQSLVEEGKILFE